MSTMIVKTTIKVKAIRSENFLILGKTHSRREVPLPRKGRNNLFQKNIKRASQNANKDYSYKNNGSVQMC